VSIFFAYFAINFEAFSPIKRIPSAVISLEFGNFGSTIVDIPADAKNSIIDLETYMSTYAIQDDIYVNPSLSQDYTYQY